MRNPWDYPPTDGFTDTYEYSKGLQDDLNYLQKGYMNKNITDLDDTTLIDEGIGDYLAGNESYAMRYFQGQLISNQIIGFNKINGSEGLLAAIGEKIKQFFKWVASIFTKEKNEAITKITVEPKNTTKGVKLNDAKLGEMIHKVKNMQAGWNTHAKNYITENEGLAERTGKLKEQFPGAYQNLEGLNTQKFEQSINHVSRLLSDMGDKLAALKTSDQLLNFVKTQQKQLWQELISANNSRVHVATMDIFKSLGANIYEKALNARITVATEVTDQEHIRDNLVALVRFSTKLSYINDCAITLANFASNVNKDYYNDKA